MRAFTMLLTPWVWAEVEHVAAALTEHRVLFGNEIWRVIDRGRLHRLEAAARSSETSEETS